MDYRDTLRRHHESLVDLQRRLKHNDAVLTALERAVEDFSQAVNTNPDTPGLHAILAHFLIEAGRTARDYGKPGPALPRLRQARALLEKLVRDQPRAHQPALAHCEFQIGLTHGRFNKVKEAVAHYERARGLQQEILDKYADSSQTHSSLSVYLHNLGLAYRRADKLDDAETALRGAVTHQAIALGRGAGSAEVRSALSGSYVVLGDLLRARGKIADAVTVTCARQKLWPKEPKELFLAARDFAKCAGLIGKDREKLSAAAQAEQDRIVELALAALRQALDLGYRDWAELDHGEAFAPLRARPALQELLRKYRM